jgi:hypothetical protein
LYGTHRELKDLNEKSTARTEPGACSRPVPPPTQRFALYVTSFIWQQKVVGVRLVDGNSQQILAESLAKSAGIQLYTVGKELKEDMAGNLAELAAIGYRVSGKRRNGREDDHGLSQSARCRRPVRLCHARWSSGKCNYERRYRRREFEDVN